MACRTAEQLQRLSPFITPELRASIERAQAIQEKQLRTKPDEKADWSEGDLFSSLFEGVSTWELGGVFNAPTTDGEAEVKQTYVEPQHEPVTWTDTLILKQQKKHWLVNDIIMGGKWPHKAGETLRSRLPGGIKKSQDHDSPDGNWHVTFLRENDDVSRITIANKNDGSEPVVLFGSRPDEFCHFPTWLVWSQDGNSFALHQGDSPRFTSTYIYRLNGRKWTPVAMPEFHPKERQTLSDNGFRERHCLIDPEYWQDSSTLVVHYFGNFTKADEGDGFDELISVRIGKNGKASIVEAVDTP